MGCSGSKAAGGVRGDQSLAPLPSSRTGSLRTQEGLGLSRSLAWIQEKNFEEKFEVVKVIGQGSIGEVSIVRKKPINGSLSGSMHGSRHRGGGGSHRSSQSHDEEISKPAFVNAGRREGDLGAAEAGGEGLPPPPPRLESAGGTAERLYAMKSIHMGRLNKLRVEEFQNEVSMLRQLHHPNIVQLREVFHYKKKIYMCMTLCTGGQLNDRSFTESQVCSVMSQVIRALIYMHETAKICHRDLKMENIMLESPEEPLVVKLIDFGLSKVFTEGDKMRTACGTVYTMAPEVLMGDGYTQKADLWSAGVIAFVLLSNSFPFLNDESDLEEKAKVERLAQARFLFSDPSWKEVSSGGKGFVRGLLKKQPGYRWTAREALNHCADVWVPAVSPPAGSADLSSEAALAAADDGASGNGNRASESRDNRSVPLSTGGSPGGTTKTGAVSPGSPTRALRGRLRAADKSIAKSLRRFADYGELKKAVLMLTAFQLDREEIKQLKDAFLEVDTNLNGAISLDELGTVLREHGVDGADVDRIFAGVDMDASGSLHYMEFLAATIEARGYIEEESLKEAFERLDVDSTGFISRNNLKAVLGKTYDPALIDKMLKEGDLSLSGSINWEDFLALMKPVVEEEYRKDAEAILRDTPAACREAAEVGLRAVNHTQSYTTTKASDGEVVSSHLESEDGSTASRNQETAGAAAVN